MIDNLSLALDIARFGWTVFPCGGNKAPIIPKAAGGNGYHDATLDEKTIREWWKQYPGAVVGIACEYSRIMVLDLDRHPGQADGIQAFTELVNKNGGRPAIVGPVQETPGNGQHLIFKVPQLPSNFEMPAKIAPGIDIRYRGYICTGTLPDGRSYRWLPEHGYKSSLTFPPAWVGELLVTNCNQNRPAVVPAARAAKPSAGRLSPGDDFANRTTWREILSGWHCTGVKGDVEHWTRPGKNGGVSATVNYGQHDGLYVFSTNAAPFEPNKSYSKFAAYAILNHAGNFKAAAAALRAAGFGQK